MYNIRIFISVNDIYRDICKFRLLCITHKAINMGVLVNLEVRIRSNNHPSRKYEPMKLFVPFVSSVYTDAAYNVAVSKY